MNALKLLFYKLFLKIFYKKIIFFIKIVSKFYLYN